MHIEIAAHHVEVTDDLRGYVDHIADHLQHIFDGITSLYVKVQAEKERRVAELVANVVHGTPVVAKVAADNLYAAIHMATDKLEAQLRKHKDKLRDHRLREPGAEAPETEPLGDETPEETTQ